MKLAKLIRDHTDLNHKQFAELIGVDANTVARWNTGRSSPSRKNARLVSEALGVSFRTIRDLNDLPSPEHA